MEKTCPIPNANLTKRLEYQLWRHSPTDGLITTKSVGTIAIVEGATGTKLVEFRVHVSIK